MLRRMGVLAGAVDAQSVRWSCDPKPRLGCPTIRLSLLPLCARLPLVMPLHCRLHPFRHQSMREVWANNVVAELLLLQELEHLESRRGERQVLQVGRARPVLEIIEVRDEGGIRKVFA